jgi:hypothetical protein
VIGNPDRLLELRVGFLRDFGEILAVVVGI